MHPLDGIKYRIDPSWAEVWAMGSSCAHSIPFCHAAVPPNAVCARIYACMEARAESALARTQPASRPMFEWMAPYDEGHAHSLLALSEHGRILTSQIKHTLLKIAGICVPPLTAVTYITWLILHQPSPRC